MGRVLAHPSSRPSSRRRSSRRPPRSRVPLHRRPAADPAALRRWLLVAVLAATTAGLCGRLVSTATATQHRWGSTRPVLVASRPVAAGAPLEGAVRLQRWPVALLPEGARSEVPAGSAAAGPLGAGSPVTSASLADRSSGSGDGRRRVAVPVGSARLPLARGDRVDVWATVDPSLAGGRPTTRRLAVDAVVTSAGPTTVVVAVRPTEVPEVAAAAALATVTLVGG